MALFSYSVFAQTSENGGGRGAGASETESPTFRRQMFLKVNAGPATFGNVVRIVEQPFQRPVSTQCLCRWGRQDLM